MISTLAPLAVLFFFTPVAAGAAIAIATITHPRRELVPLAGVIAIGSALICIATALLTVM